MFADFKIEVSRCYPSWDPTCANDTVYQDYLTTFGSFELMLPIVNTNINPGAEEYKTYYISDENWVIFDSNLGVYAYSYFS